MERMTTYQESAFDKLYRWTQSEIRALGRDSLEISAVMRSALKALRQRPMLFQHCLEQLVQVRRSAIIRLFINALTRGGPGGLPRAIETHAYDPLRYVGDMLAWVHQSVAGEREFLEGLFFDVNQAGGYDAMTDEDMQPVRPCGSDKHDIDRESDDIIVQDLLDRDLDGTCRPLKSRIEQVLGSRPGAITSYRILNLIQFYKITITRILGPNAALSVTLEEVTKAAAQVFFDTLNTQAELLLRYVQVPSADLSPPPAVKETMLQLREIMTSYDSSLVATEKREVDFAPVLNAVLDPLLQMCEVGAKDLTRFSQSIYMINCLHYVQTSIDDFSFTQPRIAAFELQIEEYMIVLVDEQYMNLLEQSGLAPIIRALDSKDENMPLSLLPHMDARSLTTAMARLDSFLTLTDTDAFRLTGNPRELVRRVNQRVGKRFVDAYARLTNAICDPRNRYEFASTILLRTVDEVETLVALD